MKVKSLSIPEDAIESFEKLNLVTPDNMSFAEQIRTAVDEFVDRREGEKYERKLPSLEESVDVWKSFIENNPEKIETIKTRVRQINGVLNGRIIEGYTPRY